MSIFQFLSTVLHLAILIISLTGVTWAHTTETFPSLSAESTSLQSNMHDANCIDSSSIIPRQKFVFSDIDGTLAHYHLNTTESKDTSSLLFLPPSATGLQAHISIHTLHLCQEIRKVEGVVLVLVSGMRTKTLFQRIPYLPRADAYVSENGGRIFYPILLNQENDDSTPSSSSSSSSSTTTSFRKHMSPILLHVKPVLYHGISQEDMQEFGIVEDLTWKHYIRQQQQQDDNDDEDLNPVPHHLESNSIINHSTYEEDLLDSLQSVVEILEKRNFTVDKVGYSTCIRVNWKQQRQDLVTKQHFDQLSSTIDLEHLGLQCSFNLGCIDFLPLRSGKKNSCEYIAEKISSMERKKKHHPLLTQSGTEILASSSLCVCDDDNDIPLATACRKAFLPTISSQSIKDLVESSKDRIIVTEDIPKGIVGHLATEAALQRVLEEVHLLGANTIY